MTPTLFHAPNSRAGAVRILLEELGIPYALHVLDLKRKQQRDPAYLAVNPMGKVPAILHHGALVTEQPAIFIYLADLVPQAGLAPGPHDPLRGPYLRWLAFYGSSFEPAIIDRALQRAPAPPSLCPYGDYDTMLATFTAPLRAGPWLLGQRFSAADILWASALCWMTGFGLVPALPEIVAYVERLHARPAVRKAMADDAALAAAQTQTQTQT
jgi:glutathione S-transferase